MQKITFKGRFLRKRQPSTQQFLYEGILRLKGVTEWGRFVLRMSGNIEELEVDVAYISQLRKGLSWLDRAISVERCEDEDNN